MIRQILRVLMSFSSTSWMLVVYAIKTDLKLWGLGEVLSSIALIAATVAVSLAVLSITKLMDNDDVEKSREVSLADNEYLPVYLGYFFVSLSVDKNSTLIFVYVMILVLITMSDAYFNPAFLLCGYHYYRVTTISGTEFFLICKSSVRNAGEIKNTKLKRINDRTYIYHGEV